MLGRSQESREKGGLTDICEREQGACQWFPWAKCY